LWGGLNTFAYVSSKPLLWVDEFGLEEGSPSNLAKRKRIDEIARSLEGSTKWAQDAKKESIGPDGKKIRFGPTKNKCNLFVYDVTNKANAATSVNTNEGNLRPPTAGEIARKTADVINWRVLGSGEKPEPGDIAAFPLSNPVPGATGHTGIITSCECEDEGTSNTSAHRDSIYPTPNQFTNERGLVYRRYTGN